MSMFTVKRQKVDNENRRFNREWTVKYLFSKASTVTIETNLRRNCLMHHSAFNGGDPMGG